MQFDNTRTLDLIDAVPRPAAPPPPPDRSAWGAPWRALKAGVSEVAGSVADVAKGFGATSASIMEADPFATAVVGSKAVQEGVAEGRRQIASGEALVSGVGDAFRQVSRDLRPDPTTSSKAEELVFGAARPLAKMVGAVLTLGPIGLGLAAAEEGFTQADDLRLQGVDQATRTGVGVLSAGMNAAGAFLPMAGHTLTATAGLYLLGGPGAFMAQQQATKMILQHADYGELAKQYSPTDTTGLLTSLLIPLPFAAHGAARNIGAARAARQVGADLAAGRAPDGSELPTEQAPTVSHEAVDAAMVHNLTLQQDVAHATVPGVDHPHLQRLPEDQRPKLAEMYAQAALLKPKFDEALGQIAGDIGGKVKLADLKGTDRTTAKIVSDYKGDASKIKDILRGTLDVDSADSAQAAVASIFQRFEVLPQGRRNLLDPGASPPDGYRDAKFNVRIGDAVAEIQVNLPAMLVAKKKAHPLYADRSALEREWEGKVTPLDVQARIDALNAQMRAIYEPAWIESTSRANSSRETGAPLRRADSESNTLGGSVSQAIEDGTPGASGRSATGTPSTSNSSALGPNAGSFIATSKPIIGENPAWQQRLRNAVFSKAYGDPALVDMLSESTDSNVRNVLNGLLRAAPDVARLNDLAAAGARQPVDVAGNVVRAVHEFAKLRADGMTVDQHLAQGSLLDGGLPPEVNNLLIGLGENARAPRRVAEMVRELTRAVDSMGDPRQSSLLDGSPASAADVTANAVERLRAITDEQLTDTPPETIKASTDPLMRMVSDRVQGLEVTAPDLPMRLDADGKPVSLAEELAQVRKAAAEGTDTELGAMDADLLRVAAECALSTGPA